MGAGQFITPVLDNYSKAHGNRFVRALGHRLVAGVEPACILALGDSTGNDSTDWFVLTMRWLASHYPAYSFYERVWENTLESYGFIYSPFQIGSAGRAYANFTGEDGSVISCPDNAKFDITGDLEISCHVTLDDWTPAATSALVSKWGSTGNNSFSLLLRDNGNLFFYWSPDGTELKSAESSVAVGGVSGASKYVKVTLDVDNGADGHEVKFYTSDNGFVWTQLGITRTGVGITSIKSGTQPLLLGSQYPSARTAKIVGKMHSAIVRNGIDGTVVASPDFGLAFPAGISTFKDVQGNEWTVNGSVTVGNGSPAVIILNACVAGQAIAYHTDATRFAKIAAYEPQIAFIDHGHNEASSTDYQATYEGLCTQVLTAWPNAGVVGVTQNPQLSPRTPAQILTQDQCQRQIVQAMVKNDYGLIDVYRAFKETGNVAGYVDADGIHPSTVGQSFWANEVIKFLQPAVS